MKTIHLVTYTHWDRELYGTKDATHALNDHPPVLWRPPVNQPMRGESINPLNVLISTVTTLIAAGLLILVAIRLYQRERILFGAR